MDKIKRIPTLVICFKNPIALYELPFFRGAIISKVPREMVLFHNHIENGFRYRYPLIQYKRIGGNASIVCIGEGTDEIGQFFAGADLDICIGERPVQLQVEDVRATRTLVQTWENTFTYSCRKWLPLNQENYDKYMQLDGLMERIIFLQKILIGNILSMCTGLGIHIENNVTCEITYLSDMSIYKYKDIKMVGFDLQFKSNISLPNYIGLGKGVSLGFGVIHQLNNNKTQ